MNVVHHARKRRAHRLTMLRASLRVASLIAPPIAVRIAGNLFSTPPRYVRHERELNVLETGERSNLTSAKQRIAIWQWGEGPNVVLIHGWGGVGSQLSNFVEPLVSAGYRVVMFDGPAHGESSGRFSSVVQFTSALSDVVDRVGGAHAIIGHSMGCASTALAMHRGLTAGRVVFLAPPASPQNYLDQFTKVLGLRPEIRDGMRKRFQEQLGFDWNEVDVPRIARALTAPLLIVHDEEDREALLQEAEDIHSAWRGSRLVVTRGLGHRRLLRDPSVVAQVTEFVRA